MNKRPIRFVADQLLKGRGLSAINFIDEVATLKTSQELFHLFRKLTRENLDFPLISQWEELLVFQKMQKFSSFSFIHYITVFIRKK
jgi:hypothetical protein